MHHVLYISFRSPQLIPLYYLHSPSFLLNSHGSSKILVHIFQIWITDTIHNNAPHNTKTNHFLFLQIILEKSEKCKDYFNENTFIILFSSAWDSLNQYVITKARNILFVLSGIITLLCIATYYYLCNELVRLCENLRVPWVPPDRNAAFFLPAWLEYCAARHEESFHPRLCQKTCGRIFFYFFICRKKYCKKWTWVMFHHLK